FIANLFVMLYLLFFLIRDEGALTKRIRDAIPLHAEQQRAFLLKFTIVIRATVKGDMLVALLQGTLGGLIFWFLGISAPLLWGVVMAFFSGSSGNRVDESNGECGLNPHGYWGFGVS
ncbi:MAG: AI-2E family transporter, partial [Gemmatimonadaceae bacterium]